jgi:hypothetical protein
MVKKAMPKGKPFKKGQSGNPGGQRKLPEDIKEARKLNQIELERIVNKYLWRDRASLKEAMNDPTTPMMELMVASIMAIAVQKGDQQRVEWIMSRLIGKVTDKLEVKMPEPLIIRRASGEQLELTARQKQEEE